MNELIPQTPIVVTGTTSLSDVSWSGCSGSYGAAISIAASGALSLDNAELMENRASGFGGAVFNEGTLTLAEGVAFTANTAAWNGGAICSKKSLAVAGATFSRNRANAGGAVEAWVAATISETLFSGNTATYGGAVKIGSGKATLTGVVFAGNSAEVGGAILNYAEMTLEDVAFDGNDSLNGGAICNFEGGTATLKNVSLLTVSDTILNDGTMLFQGTISLAGSLTTSSAIAADGVSLVFDISRYAAGNASAIVGDLAQLVGVAEYGLAVAENQAAGTYALAGNAVGIAATLSLKCGEYEAMALSVGNSVAYHNSVYALALAGGTATVTAQPFQQSGAAEALAWADINGAERYALELTCGTQTLALNLASENAELLGLANGGYTWRVRNAAEADNWQNGQAFAQTEAPVGPQELIATGTDATALFFAKTDGAWDDAYVARNMLTGETAQLSGKAKLTDIFTGNGQASILLLDAFELITRQVPEAEASGVALFLDDIYSAAPSPVPEATASGQAAARLANIGTIVATDGDDIIDLTSDRYAFAGGVTILGGAGDDTIWANGSGNILAGGVGSDRLVGGGTEDTFCFGEDWGQDDVVQLDGGKVVLWFAEGDESKWDAATMTYRDGADTVSLHGAGLTVELRFGAAAAHEAEFGALAAAGAFA